MSENKWVCTACGESLKCELVACGDSVPNRCPWRNDSASWRAVRQTTTNSAMNAICRWADNGDGGWDTGCGEVWYFPDGGPKENRVMYCPYCGRQTAS